jgi:hypothetical protein
VVELAERERTEEDIERLHDAGGRLSRRAASLEKEVAVLTDRVDRLRMEVAQQFALMAMEGRLRQITDVISTLQSNAYGQTGSVLSASNLLLAGNQLFWTLLDPVLRQSGVLTKSESFTLSLLTPIVHQRRLDLGRDRHRARDAPRQDRRKRVGRLPDPPQHHCRYRTADQFPHTRDGERRRADHRSLRPQTTVTSRRACRVDPRYGNHQWLRRRCLSWRACSAASR